MRESKNKQVQKLNAEGEVVVGPGSLTGNYDVSEAN
jgi:hypothetical protein